MQTVVNLANFVYMRLTCVTFLACYIVCVVSFEEINPYIYIYFFKSNFYLNKNSTLNISLNSFPLVYWWRLTVNHFTSITSNYFTFIDFNFFKTWTKLILISHCNLSHFLQTLQYRIEGLDNGIRDVISRIDEQFGMQMSLTF